MQLYRKLKSPVCIQVELTTACNCRCSHCYNYWRPLNEKIKFMTKDVADRILDIVQENEIKKVCLTGGEPFLNFEIFKYMTEQLQARNVTVSTNTNLSAVTEEQLDYALKHNLRIFTTVMGADADTHDKMTNAKGSFDRTIKNITKCIQMNNDVMVNVVVSKPILHKVFEIGAYLAKLGINQIFVSLVICPEYAVGTDKESDFLFNDDDVACALNSLLDVRDKFNVNVGTITTFPLCSLGKVRDVTPFMNRRCVAGRSELGISCEGMVSRCPQSSDYIGSIMAESFETVWKCADCSTSDAFPNVCTNCPLLKMCSGGCRVSAKSDCGKWNGLDPKATPQNINMVLKNIDEHYGNLLPTKDVSGYCRKEAFGAILIRTDGNYSLLDKYFTNDELKDEHVLASLSKHTLPIILKNESCIINDDCKLCKLRDVCYNIHNCR